MILGIRAIVLVSYFSIQSISARFKFQVGHYHQSSLLTALSHENTIQPTCDDQKLLTPPFPPTGPI